MEMNDHWHVDQNYTAANVSANTALKLSDTYTMAEGSFCVSKHEIILTFLVSLYGLSTSASLYLQMTKPVLLHPSEIGKLGSVLEEFLSLSSTTECVDELFDNDALHGHLNDSTLNVVCNDFLESFSHTLSISDEAVDSLCGSGPAHAVRLLLRTTVYRPSFKSPCTVALSTIVKRSRTACLLDTIIAIVEECETFQVQTQLLHSNIPRDVIDALIECFSYRASLTYKPLPVQLTHNVKECWTTVFAATKIHPYLKQAISSCLVSISGGVDVFASLRSGVRTSSVQDYGQSERRFSFTDFRSNL
ncbi:hypothetical protein P9112_003633 [Eukaryota sp. TZLM1-RC]